MSFVIRSMSTTDYRPADRFGPEQKPVPYHIYLMVPEKRASAWWSRSMLDAMKFSTEDEAKAEFDRLFGDKPDYAKPEIAPADAEYRGLPTFWENRKARTAA